MTSSGGDPSKNLKKILFGDSDSESDSDTPAAAAAASDDDDTFEESTEDVQRQKLQAQLEEIKRREVEEKNKKRRKVDARFERERETSLQGLDDAVGEFHRLCKEGAIYPKPNATEEPMPTARLIAELQRLVVNTLRANAPSIEDFLSACERFSAGCGTIYSQMEERYTAATKIDKIKTDAEAAAERVLAHKYRKYDEGFVVPDGEGEETYDDDDDNYTPSSSGSEGDDDDFEQPTKRRKTKKP